MRIRSAAIGASILVAASLVGCASGSSAPCSTGPCEIAAFTIGSFGKGVSTPSVTVDDADDTAELTAILDEHGVLFEDVDLTGMCTDQVTTIVSYAVEASTYDLRDDMCSEGALADALGDFVVDIRGDVAP